MALGHDRLSVVVFFGVVGCRFRFAHGFSSSRSSSTSPTICVYPPWQPPKRAKSEAVDRHDDVTTLRRTGQRAGRITGDVVGDARSSVHDQGYKHPVEHASGIGGIEASMKTKSVRAQ